MAGTGFLKWWLSLTANCRYFPSGLWICQEFWQWRMIEVFLLSGDFSCETFFKTLLDLGESFAFSSLPFFQAHSVLYRAQGSFHSISLSLKLAFEIGVFSLNCRKQTSKPSNVRPFMITRGLSKRRLLIWLNCRSYKMFYFSCKEAFVLLLNGRITSRKQQLLLSLGSNSYFIRHVDLPLARKRPSPLLSWCQQHHLTIWHWWLSWYSLSA